MAMCEIQGTLHSINLTCRGTMIDNNKDDGSVPYLNQDIGDKGIMTRMTGRLESTGSTRYAVSGNTKSRQLPYG